MDENCKECHQPLKENYKACLKCHCFCCYYCEDDHTRNNRGHLFRIPYLETYSYTLLCKQHSTVDDQYCKDCSALICRICVNTDHKGHITRPIDQSAYQQKKEVTSEIERIVKSNKKVQTQLDERERNLDQLIKKANDIEFNFDQEYKRIKALLFEQGQNSKSFFKSPQNEDLCAFLSEIKSLKATIKINKELEKTLVKLLEETRTANSKGFLKGYAEFRKHSEMLVTYPKAVGDEFLSLEIDYRTPTDEEMKNLLPRICIGSKRDIQRARRQQEEENDTSKVDSTRTQKDTREKDKQITDLHDKLRSTSKVIEVLSENVIRLADASSSMDRPSSSLLETPRNLPTYLNMDKKLENIHLSMENIKRNIEKKNMLFKTTKDKNKELEESPKRLKTTDAQAKEQEEYIRRGQLEKSEVEIQKWKKTVVEIQDRYETMYDQHETMKRKLKRSEEEKENFMTRLSQVAGAKLTAGNSSIADLGDKYRPTRISEMFAEMYDSDWTDVMDSILESHKDLTEESAVRHIFIVLQECFRACKRIATEQMKRLCEDMFLSASTQDLSHYVETHVTEIKQLQDARKGTAPFVGKMLKERVFGDSTFGQNCRRIKGISMSLVSQITESGFGQQCLNICWFMVVQDPEMHIDGHLQHGIKFDKEVYKEYTKSGKRVAFSVWPALYLNKDGPLLTKGVAQPCD